MRKFSLGFGMICCVAAATMLGACAKNSDCGDKDCCKEKAASASMMGEKKSCESSCAKSCKDKAEASPSMMSEGKQCPMSGSTGKCCKSQKAE